MSVPWETGQSWATRLCWEAAHCANTDGALWIGGQSISGEEGTLRIREEREEWKYAHQRGSHLTITPPLSLPFKSQGSLFCSFIYFCCLMWTYLHTEVVGKKVTAFQKQPLLSCCRNKEGCGKGDLACCLFIATFFKILFSTALVWCFPTTTQQWLFLRSLCGLSLAVLCSFPSPFSRIFSDRSYPKWVWRETWLERSGFLHFPIYNWGHSHLCLLAGFKN